MVKVCDAIISDLPGHLLETRSETHDDSTSNEFVRAPHERLHERSSDDDHRPDNDGYTTTESGWMVQIIPYQRLIKKSRYSQPFDLPISDEGAEEKGPKGSKQERGSDETGNTS